MTLRKSAAAVAWLIMLSTVVSAAMAQTRDEKVIDDRDALANEDSWFYDDLQAGMDEAAASGKPLMVVLRCIP